MTAGSRRPSAAIVASRSLPTMLIASPHAARDGLRARDRRQPGRDRVGQGDVGQGLAAGRQHDGVAQLVPCRDVAARVLVDHQLDLLLALQRGGAGRRADDDVRGLVAVGVDAVDVGRLGHRLGGIHAALVGDDLERDDGGVHPDPEGDGDGLARQHGTDRHTQQRRIGVVGRTLGGGERARDVCRADRHGVGEDHIGHGRGALVAQQDGVLERVAAQHLAAVQVGDRLRPPR